MSHVYLSRFPITRMLVFSGLVLCCSVLKADIIYGNFGAGFTYIDGNGVVVTNGTVDFSVAEEFTVPASNYDLSSIEFVASTKTTPDPSNTVTVGIYADNGGVPAATALETITLTGSLAPFDGTLSPVLTATSLTNPELMAGLQYWLVMDGSPAENLVWDNNSTLAEGYLETNGTAGQWVLPNPFVSETNGVFEIDGTLLAAPTPEPQAWMLAAGGFALISLLIRRQSKNAA